MKLYEILNTVTDSVYVGITRNTLDARWRGHKHCAKRGTKTPLYDSMRSKGIDKFYIKLVKEFESEQEMLNSEKELISYYRSVGRKCYNILDGGESYFYVKDKDAWIKHLKDKRKGRRPALGMKHTEDNKKKFGEFGKMRWDIYGRYPDDVINYSFKDAKDKYGISKTHYYRLRKLGGSNESS